MESELDSSIHTVDIVATGKIFLLLLTKMERLLPRAFFVKRVKPLKQ